MTKHKRNHLASRFYLARWTAESGRLTRIRVPGFDSVERTPDAVGWRGWYWGSDHALCARVEKAIRPIESAAAIALAELKDNWPVLLPDDRRIAISSFLALQLLRSPASRRRHMEIEMGLLRSDLRETKSRLSPDSYEQYIRMITTDEFRVDTELQGVPKLSGLLASMHWTLVEFCDPLLATCDQPVQVVPFLRNGESVDIKGIPDTGLFEVQEIRVPIDPHHFLLLSWREVADDREVAHGNDWMAAQMNRATLAQADGEWFHHPARRPTTLNPRNFGETFCSPLAPFILRGYSSDEAIHSRRRAETNGMIDKMIREGNHETIGVLYPTPMNLAA